MTSAACRRWAALAACAALGAPLALAADEVLARVGDRVLDGARFQARAATLPAARWPQLGASWPERRRRLLDVLIDELLLSVADEQRPALPSARDSALARALRAELSVEPVAVPSAGAPAAPSAPSAPSAPAAPSASADEAGQPRALELFRILVHTDAEARVLRQQLAEPSVARFGQLARSASIDGATSMRAGYLGWVADDGQTDVPELRVAPELFRAAEAAADGELLREPVREGEAFAVVWRRASRPGRTPSDAEREQGRAARLAEEALAAAERALLDGLRRDRLDDYHPERLADFEPSFPEQGRRAPAPSPPALVAPWLTPVPTDRGLR